MLILKYDREPGQTQCCPGSFFLCTSYGLKKGVRYEMTNAKRTGTTLSIPYGIALGVCAALCTTVSCSAITAKMVDQQWIHHNHIGYAIMVFLLLAAWIGTRISYKKIKRQKVLVCMLTGIAFYGILLCITAIFFGGQYSGVGETGLLILGGTLLSALPEHSNKSRKIYGKRKKYNR